MSHRKYPIIDKRDITTEKVIGNGYDLRVQACKALISRLWAIVVSGSLEQLNEACYSKRSIYSRSCLYIVWLECSSESFFYFSRRCRREDAEVFWCWRPCQVFARSCYNGPVQASKCSRTSRSCSDWKPCEIARYHHVLSVNSKL